MANKNIWIRLVLLPLLIFLAYAAHLIKVFFFCVLELFWKSPLASVVRTPDSRFDNAAKLGYTFKPNYVELPIGGGKTLPRVHYVDEGPRDAKETILCLHGEPSWSFLYRHVINTLTKAGFRVIAPDFIGFGKSDKFTHPEAYSHELHTMTLRLLLDHLQVKNLTLVCQDWGGLTGLSVVKDCPDRFSRLVIMNTGLPVGGDFSINTLSKLTPFLMWRAFAQLFGTHLPVKRIFR
ncbi:haloalkane dehalogenase, partial [Hyalella azteca]|uniref:Haloalkane dehalogenase n=1 Tax=Hyalella azteca TaxID=294128 RepID=A0A8B7NLH9_HYAAZ